jgi:FixJ family two-component response regulator
LCSAALIRLSLAAWLIISKETVRTHAALIRRKLGVKSKQELVEMPNSNNVEPEAGKLALDGCSNPF